LTGYGGSFESAAAEVAKAIDGSVGSAIEGEGRIAVAFSGGVDSSILAVCAKRRAKVVACSASAQGALDHGRAEASSRILGVELVTTKLTPELVRSETDGLDLPFEPTAMDRSLWCLYTVVSRSAAAAGAGVILLGQLSDELFGGYAKYEAALQREGEGASELLMTRDVLEYPRRGRVRDYRACARWLTPKFPFEAKEVRELGVSMPVSYKIRDGVRKAVLRRAAVILGVPEELAMAPKKAAQYSSGIQRMLR
jgi:asparagine synthase (glutamine-hydrolysing)